MNITTKQVEEMAQVAMQNYEFSCCWRSAGQAAREHAADEFGIKKMPQQVVGLAVRLAQTAWYGAGNHVKRQVAA